MREGTLLSIDLPKDLGLIWCLVLLGVEVGTGPGLNLVPLSDPTLRLSDFVSFVNVCLRLTASEGRLVLVQLQQQRVFVCGWWRT